jgi:hypothetical protein
MSLTIRLPSIAEMTRNQIPDINIEFDWVDGFGYAFALKTEKEADVKGKTIEFGWSGAYHSNYYV